MSFLHPIYTDDDVQQLSTDQRRALSAAIAEVLQTDEQVQNLIKQKTHDLFEELKKKKET
jgi:hypothetical protein